MANSITRRVGIPGTSTVHWGEHLCAFFYTKTDLLNLVVPYIKAGLEDNEFCLWITEEGMEQQAIEALERVLPHASQYVSCEQLEIVPASKWYLTAGISTQKDPMLIGRPVAVRLKPRALWGHGRRAILFGFSLKRIGISFLPTSTRSTRPLNLDV
jgi:hypothetical protein